jgi:hypothetical protein
VNDWWDDARALADAFRAELCLVALYLSDLGWFLLEEIEALGRWTEDALASLAAALKGGS